MDGLHQEVGLIPGRHYRPQGNNSTRVLSLKLRGINPHYRKQIQAMIPELSMFAGMSDDQLVRVGWQGQNITVEIPKPEEFCKEVTIEDLDQRRMFRRGVIATLGLGLQDEPRRIDFSEEAVAHVLVSGQTRIGKTNTQKLIAWNLCQYASPDDTKLIIFDVEKRGYKWNQFGQVQHLVHPVITRIEEAERVLSYLSGEINSRADSGQTEPRIFVVIDELKALNDESELVGANLARIASLGGEFGLHLILATQYPQVQMLGESGSELKRNITTRLCGRVDDANAATNALGVKRSGAESLQGKGDFLLRDLDGLFRLTVAHLKPEHIERLPRSDTVQRLELPHNDTVQAGPGPMPGPGQLIPVKPEEVALTLCQTEPTVGISKLAQMIRSISGSCSKERAERIREFANQMRMWAAENGHDSLPGTNYYVRPGS